MNPVVGRRLVVVVFVGLLLGPVAAGTVAAGEPTIDEREGVDRAEAERVLQPASAPTNLTVTQVLRLTPDEPGSIGVTIRYTVPDRVSKLKTTVPTDVAVTEITGFSQADGETYEWDGETTSPSIRYTVPVNESRDVAGPKGGPGEYLFVDAGEWAMFRRPTVATTWGWRGGEPVRLTRETETAGPGYAGEWIVFMGRHDVHERRAHGQRLRLIVPTRATLAESPAEILDALATASDQLRVGDRDERVTVVAAPTTAVKWGVRGLQLGEADVWVRDAEELDTVDNTWLHEYVHTRQDYEETAGTEWTTEAMATYYAALLAVEQDRAGLGTFGPFLARGEIPPQSAAVLSDPTTWQNAANYWKGSLVVGDLDRRIRQATTGERSLQTVLSRMNAHRGAINRSDLEAMMSEVAGDAARDPFVRFSTTPRVPEIWSRTTHEAVFGSTPARVSVRYADRPDAFTVTGPYRNETLKPTRPGRTTVDGPKLSVYAGETVVARATVTNTGGAATEYEARFAVDDRIVATRSGSIRPEERARHTFRRSFEDSGQHVLAVGSDEVTVEVFEPVSADVTELRANRTSLSGPGRIELRATVNNTLDAPASGNVTIGRSNETVVDRQVPVPPNGQRVVTATVSLPESGEYTFQVGTADPLTVTVGGPFSGIGDGETGDEGTGDDGDGAGKGNTDGDESESAYGPGFGPGFALVVALVAALLLARRRRSS